MAVVITENLIAGSGLRITSSNRELRRVFHFIGLTAGPLITDQAYSELASQLSVSFGSTVTLTDGVVLVADDFDFVPFQPGAKTQVVGTVVYHPTSFSSVYQPITQFNGTSREITTHYKQDGSLIQVKYTPPGGAEKTVTGEVTRHKAYGILTVERVENEDPTGRLQWIDSINNDNFFGQGKWTWCMRDIVIRKLAYTAGFQVTYIAEYDWQTHLKAAAWRDPITGNIPADVDTNPDPYGTLVLNGVTMSIENPILNWGPLGLPQSFNG